MTSVTPQKIRPHELRIDLALILLFASAIAGVCLYNANAWFFSYVGDEWTVFGRAEKVAKSRGVPLLQIFGPLRSGEYKVHAPILTAVQGVFLKIFGISNFGWRTSGILLAAFSSIPFYIIARALLSRTGAVVASLLMISSYYLIVESMWGYGWTQMRFFSLITVASLVLFMQRPGVSRALMVGVAAGWCTLLTGLAAYIAPLSLAIAMVYWWRARKGTKWELAIPATLVAAWWGFSKLPGRLLGEYESFTEQMKETMWKTSLGPFLGSVLGPEWEPNREAYAPSPDQVWSYIASMMGKAVIAPVLEVRTTHFLFGRMIDPVFGCTAIAGFVLALILAYKRTEWRIFWLYFIPAMFFTAGLSPYAALPNTRLHFLVPFWAISAGLVLQYVLVKLPQALRVVLITGWLSVASYWGLHKAFHEVPHKIWFDESAYVIELIQRLPDYRFVFVGKGWGGAIRLFEPYGFSDRAEWKEEISAEEETKQSAEPKTLVLRRTQLKAGRWSPEVLAKTGLSPIRPPG
jgi:hypothetical protein